MALTLAMPLASTRSVFCTGDNQISLPRHVSFPAYKAPQVRRLTIQNVRVGGVEIPNNKRIEYSLQYIHGIGRSRSRRILNDVDMFNKVTKDLDEMELKTLREEVAKYMIEGDLRRFTALCIKRLKDIKCYRGLRHIQGLPCRGQRTRNNCRTLKGKRKTVAGKKKTPR